MNFNARGLHLNSFLNPVKIKGCKPIPCMDCPGPAMVRIISKFCFWIRWMYSGVTKNGGFKAEQINTDLNAAWGGC
jgi:hypothetical protein